MAQVWAEVATGIDPSNDEAADLVRLDWKPLPGPQTQAIESPADEVLYGGAAGGGKTDLILGTALTQHRSSIIFRRELSQMKGPEGIISRSEQIVGADGTLNRTAWVWKNLPGGRSLEFAGVPHEHSKNRYKGRPHDLIAFDELTEFTRTQYRFLTIWNRTAIPGQRCRVISTTNPPVTEAETWVIEEWAPWLDPDFPEPAGPGELRYYYYEGEDLKWTSTPDPVEVGGEWKHPRSRTFIPASLEDNPYLLETDYARTLDALPDELREAFKKGTFAYGLSANPLQVIPTAWVRLAQDRWKALHAEGFTPAVPMTALGVDPSRGGRDRFVLCPRYGDYVPGLYEYEGQSTPDGATGAGYIAAHHEDDAVVIVDVIGYGSSAYDHAKDQFDCVPFNGSEKTKARDKSGKFGFVNKRAAAYWRLREMLEPGSGYELALPDSNALRQALCAPLFKLVKSGIQIQSKDEIKAKLGRSPDDADAVVYAFADPDADRFIVTGGTLLNIR